MPLLNPLNDGVLCAPVRGAAKNNATNTVKPRPNALRRVRILCLIRRVFGPPPSFTAILPEANLISDRSALNACDFLAMIFAAFFCPKKARNRKSRNWFKKWAEAVAVRPGIGFARRNCGAQGRRHDRRA